MAALVLRLWHKNKYPSLSIPDRQFLRGAYDLHGLEMLIAAVVCAQRGDNPRRLAHTRILPEMASIRRMAEAPVAPAPRARPDVTPEAAVDTTPARKYLEAMPEAKRSEYTTRFMAWLRRRDLPTWQALNVLNHEGRVYQLSVVDQLARHHTEFEKGKIRLLTTSREAVAV